MKNMKVIPIILLAVIVTACSANVDSNSNLNKEEVIDMASSNFSEIDSLSQEVVLELTNDFNNIVETTIQNLSSVLIYGDNGSITHIHSINEVIAQSRRETVEFYRTPEGMLIDDGFGWQEYIGPEDYSTTYENILNSFISASSEFDMTENNDNYQFTFLGQDGNIFRTIGEPYSLIFNSFPDDDIELDIEFLIDNEEFHISDITIHALGDYGEGNQASILTTVVFYDFNEYNEGNFPEPDDLSESGKI